MTYKKVKVEVKVPAKTPEDQPTMRNQKALRIYEHDLHNFNKIKAVDLLTPYTKITRADVINKRFGRIKDGFYYISEKQNKKDSDSKKIFTFLKSNREEIPIEFKDSITKVTKGMTFVEKFYPNEKGDKMLMIYRKNDKFNFLRLSLDLKDPKNKKYKQENFDFKNLKEYIGEEQKIKNFIFRVLPVNNDFLIVVQKVGKETGDVYVFLNDQFIC